MTISADTTLHPLVHRRAGAQYIAGDRAFSVTLRQLKLVAVLAPILAVIVLEIVRTMLFGEISLRNRLILDGALMIAIVAFSAVIFRYVDQMQNRLKRQNQELLALHGAGLDVAAELSLDAVLKKVVDQARNLVGARYGALSVINDQNRIETFLTSGITPQQRQAIGPPPVGHGLLGVVLYEGQSLRMRDLSQDPRSQGFPPNHPPMHSLLAVPIPCKGPFKGNLYLSEKEAAQEFTADDEETLERFALQAGIAIDNAHLHQQVADLAVAQERLRIAHEMHDGLAQVLGYVNTKVQAASEYMHRGKNEEASAQLRELALSARQAYTDVRESIVSLRTLPSPDRPLGEVLQDFLDGWKAQTGISTHLTIDGELRLRPRVELQIVRIVQEALTNVRKHARATVARVEMRRRDGELVVNIADDGVGFDPAVRSRSDFPRFGLSTMRERAQSLGGVLEVHSELGKGTTVQFVLPLQAALSD
jgi:signal transduction histidine kinase